MAKILNAVLIITLYIYSAQCTESGVCLQKGPCTCEFSEYSKIDLTKVIDDLEPHKEDHFLKDEKNGSIYHFHGCTDDNLNATYKDANKTISQIYKGTLIVQNGKNTSEAQVLGLSSQIRFNPIKDVPNAYELIFFNGTEPTANVRLICDDFNQPFIKVLENTTNVAQLVLSSPHACIITHHEGMSGGAVFLLLACIFICIYLVFGSCYMYFMRGARGLELIPNIDFWRSLPGLVKDGVIFLFSGCNPSIITTADTYDRI